MWPNPDAKDESENQGACFLFPNCTYHLCRCLTSHCVSISTGECSFCTKRLLPHLVGLSLEVTLRKDYPNEIPDLMVRPLKGVTSKQSKELLEKLVEQAKELVGMQMVFPLAQYLKDWLDEQNKDNLAKQKDAAKAKEELEIEKEKEVRSAPSASQTPSSRLGCFVCAELSISFCISSASLQLEEHNTKVQFFSALCTSFLTDLPESLLLSSRNMRDVIKTVLQ